MRKIRWGRLLRRTLALCLAALILWLLGTALGTWAAAARAWSGGEALLTALRLELGDTQETPMPFLLRLAVNQSPLFAANLTAAPTPLPVPTPEALPDAQPAPDRDDGAAPPQLATAPDNIVEMTLVPNEAEGYLTGAGLYLYDRADREVDLKELLTAPLELSLAPAEEGPQILIYHTHTTEAYAPDGDDTYVATDPSRTVDQTQNMLRIGDELERVFTEMGLNVLHDRDIYDYPQYDGAYSRSREAVEAALEKYPTLQIVLDVHRDALIDGDGTVYKAVTAVDGVKTAQILLVAGSDAGESPHPRWRENLSLCLKVQKSLDTLFPTLARPVILRGAVYNQDLAPGALLVEVGTHGNTLQEALAGARDFARGAGAVFLSLVEEGP